MMENPASNPIRIAAAVVIDEAGRFLLVRKRGTTAFIQPGGKIESGEAPHQALSRELFEELGVKTDVGQESYAGRAEATAVNEAGRTVVAELFRVSITTPLKPAAEIEELIWVHPSNTVGLHIAPLTRDYVLTLS